MQSIIQNRSSFINSWPGRLAAHGADMHTDDLCVISMIKSTLAGNLLMPGEEGLIFCRLSMLSPIQILQIKQSGLYCFFSDKLIEGTMSIANFPQFKQGNITLVKSTGATSQELNMIFNELIQEYKSDFLYKQDRIKSLILALIYQSLRMQLLEGGAAGDSNCSLRIHSRFTHLLESQFPIGKVSDKISLRYPSDFADKLSIHVNHLNRSLKNTTGRTTYQLINKKLTTEAQLLLKYTDWNISEIGRCLGFEELSHFINFFKKTVNATPKIYRRMQYWSHS